MRRNNFLVFLCAILMFVVNVFADDFIAQQENSLRHLPVRCANVGVVMPAPEDYDSAQLIEQALLDAPHDGVVYLKSGLIYDLNRPIWIPKGNVTLQTCFERFGEPPALLRVTNRDGSETEALDGTPLIKDATAIYAYHDYITIQYIEIDGGGPWDDYGQRFGNTLPPNNDNIKYRTGLIAAGGESKNITVRHTTLREPLGWSALALYSKVDEYHEPLCTDVLVEHNTIINAGRFDKSTEGNNRWADGISVACRSRIVGNTVINPTDVGIVLFLAGTSVVDNHILVTGSPFYLMGGIGMGNCTSNGNYSDTTVSGNIIEARSGGLIGLGMHVGPTNWRCWFCKDWQGNYITNFDLIGSVWSDNVLKGEFRYGFVISNSSNLVTENNSYEGAFLGDPLSCVGRTAPPGRGALIALEDYSSNVLGEPPDFWDWSYPSEMFYRLH